MSSDVTYICDCGEKYCYGMKCPYCSEDDAPRISKADILLEISRNPGLYADDLAERLGIPTKLVVELVNELIDEGILG